MRFCSTGSSWTPTSASTTCARATMIRTRVVSRRGTDSLGIPSTPPPCIRTPTRTTGVQLSDGTLIKTKTIVWTAGTAPNPLLADLTCTKDHGRIVANEFLEVPDWPGVWALGDCALIPDPKTGKPYPPTAQHALRQGRVLARNIAAAMNGGRKKPFVFSTLGQLATIGRRIGVANIMGINFS